MRRDLINWGVALITIGIVLYFIGSYLSSQSYFMENMWNDIGQAYDTYNLGNSLEAIGILIAVVGIVLIPIGYVVSPTSPIQNYQQSIQPVYQQPHVKQFKYCPECGKQITSDSRFCNECGSKV